MTQNMSSREAVNTNNALPPVRKTRSHSVEEKLRWSKVTRTQRNLPLSANSLLVECHKVNKTSSAKIEKRSSKECPRYRRSFPSKIKDIETASMSSSITNVLTANVATTTREQISQTEPRKRTAMIRNDFAYNSIPILGDNRIILEAAQILAILRKVSTGDCGNKHSPEQVKR